MFLKYQQTHPLCAQNEYTIVPKTGLQIVGIKHRRKSHSIFIPVVLFIIVYIYNNIYTLATIFTMTYVISY